MKLKPTTEAIITPEDLRQIQDNETVIKCLRSFNYKTAHLPSPDSSAFLRMISCVEYGDITMRITELLKENFEIAEKYETKNEPQL